MFFSESSPLSTRLDRTAHVKLTVTRTAVREVPVGQHGLGDRTLFPRRKVQ